MNSFTGGSSHPEVIQYNVNTFTRKGVNVSELGNKRRMGTLNIPTGSANVVFVVCGTSHVFLLR